MRRAVVAGSLVALVIGGVLVGSSPAAPAMPIRPGVVNDGVSLASTDQVLVRFRAGGLASKAALARASGRAVELLRALDSSTFVLRLPSAEAGSTLAGTLRGLASVSDVEWVEPDVRMFAAAFPPDPPNDPSYASQWDLGPDGPSVFGINVAGAWTTTTGSSNVRVAVVDTGYLDHADLAGRFLPGYDFISDSRIANDGGGRDADAHDAGDWTTAAENASGFFAGCGVYNSSWHGTHVSGTIGAVTNNGTGVAGINPTSKIVPVRVLGKCGGYTSDIVDGIKWAAGLPVSGVPNNPNPARVINLSLGGSGACSSTWQNAINAVNAVGIVVVAAGNSNANAANSSPASCAGVITVASTGKAGNRAYYSNFGSSVEIAAPGGDKNADGVTILSTLNTGTTTPVPSPAGDTYVNYQGTSMATPHVVGVVSLVLSINPSLTPAQVTTILQNTSTPFPAGSTCLTSGCGAGILDAAAAAAAAGSPPAPVPPGAFGKSSPANGAQNQARVLTLSWGASTDATSYQYCIDTTVNGACGGSWSSTGTARSVSLALSRNRTYEWQVRAVNNDGTTYANANSSATGAWWTFKTR